MLPRTQQILSRRSLLHASRRPTWHENLWTVESSTHASLLSAAASALACDVAHVHTALHAQLRRLLTAVADDKPASYLRSAALPRVDAAGVFVRHGAVPKGSLIASWPGISFLPTDIMAILHAGPEQFPDLAWLWRLQQRAQTARLQQQQQQEQQQQQLPAIGVTRKDDVVMTRSDGVVFDATGCDVVHRFVNPFALAHRMRVSGAAANVIAFPLDVALATSDERLVPFLGNLPCPLGVGEIMSPADNSLNLTSDADKDPFQPLLLFVTTRDVGADEELLMSE
jgi:hypothetical protein